MKKTVKVKKKRAKRRATKRKTTEDIKTRKKYARGGRIEGYTMGEAGKGRGFPW